MGALTVAHSWGAGRALASEPELPEAARAEFFRAEAEREFAAGNYREAIEPLTQGYALTHDPRFLLNLGVIYHWLGECELARDNYERFSRAAADGPLRTEALEALEALYPVCGRSRAAAPPPAVAPDLASSRPLPAPNAATPRDPAGNPSEGNVAAWSFISVGAGALLGAAVSGSLWWSSSSDYRALVADAPSSGQTWDACCAERGDQLQARAARYRAVTAGLGVGSAVLIATGVVLWRSGETEHAELSLALGEGVGLRYGAAF
jgi:tetratricopeptide (TPR) repeat protein